MNALYELYARLANMVVWQYFSVATGGTAAKKKRVKKAFVPQTAIQIAFK